MGAFSAEQVSSLPGPDWLRAQRGAAFERFQTRELPTEAEEVWRYSRISDLQLAHYQPLSPAEAPGPPEMPPELKEVVAACGERAGLLWLHNGRVARVELDPALTERGVAFGSPSAPGTPAPGSNGDASSLLGSVAEPVDIFVDLSAAFVVDPVLLIVPRGVVVDRPIVVVHWVDAPGSAVFPRLAVRTAELAEVTVVDYIASPQSLPTLVTPVVELDVGDASTLSYINVQQLGQGAWQVGYQASRVGRDATLNSISAAMGADYARVRTDSRLAGQGGTSNLLALYFGDADQMHDFRTMQDHKAAKTMSDLLFKGAVEDHAHSVYSGLIRVRKGASGTNAFQTNRNLVLDEGAHADSVPNLEIEENDVRCSHASAVGPIDEDHRYYLESRGVPPDVANRLIVLGFCDEVIQRIPVAGLRQPLRRAVAAKLGPGR